MRRSLLIYLSKAGWAQRLVMGWGLAWRTASRFVAGITIEDALPKIRELNAKGINVTLDHLGEHTSSPKEAAEATQAILRTLDVIKHEDLCANVSIKLTQVGLGLDDRACRENVSLILERARLHHNFVRIDMEDTPYTDQTIDVFHDMRHQGHHDLGMVLQSYLYRSEQDARHLLAEGTPIRLVKGAYQEPASKAFPRKADVDANFDRLAQLMLDAALAAHGHAAGSNGCFPPLAAFGTHDERRIDFARQYAQKIGLSQSAYEFQMLYGIRRDLQEQLVQGGHLVRVYVPFGTHWYPYYMRRLAERPANLWFFVSNLLRD
jgi:proline dehydrogenase